MKQVSFVIVFSLMGLSTLSAFQYVKEVTTHYPYEIKESKKLTLPLDAYTGHPWIMGSYFQYLPTEKSLAYLNKIGSSIKLFDLSTGTTLKTVPLSRVGPNSIGNEPSAFYWLNQDSIFIFSDLNNGRLSLINGEGEKLKNYELQSKNDQHFVELSEVAGGLVYSKGKLILGLRVASFNKMPLRSAILSLDIQSGEFIYMQHPLPVEENLLTKIPIDQRYSSTYLAYNHKEDKLIVSFPLSDSLLAKNRDAKWSKHEAGSVYFDELVFLKKPMASYEGTTKKYMDEVRFMPRYTGVFYDPYRQVYYRIGRLTYNKELHLRRKTGSRLKIYQEFSIQVFNKALEKVGESKFFTKGLLYEQGLFIDEQGLWLLCPQEDDEDVMEFRLMKLTKTD